MMKTSGPTIEGRLTAEIARFKAWAVDCDSSSGEWECEYTDWAALYAAVEAAFAAGAIDSPDDTEKDMMLYAIARDNECERLSGALSQYPELLMKIARHAIGYPDWNARWQIPVVLGKVQLSGSVELIRAFVTDEEEYVRRRSLIELVKFCPEEAEAIAITNMDDEFEYTRIAALHVLSQVNSDRLAYFLDRHENDPNEYVRYKVAKLRN